jgi:hypothetical protein
MTLFDLHVELATTNQLLARIADALDRAFPIPATVRPEHPLVGIADVSIMTPAHARELAMMREEQQYAARFASHDGVSTDAGGASSEAARGAAAGAAAGASVVGDWDSDDPLDDLIGEGGHTNRW